MKSLQITVLLLVLSISMLEALKCYSCVTINGNCSPEEEGCEDVHDMCGTVTIDGDVSKGCMTMAELDELANTDKVLVSSCPYDLCN